MRKHDMRTCDDRKRKPSAGLNISRKTNDWKLSF